MVKRGRKPRIDAEGCERALALAEQGLAQKEICARLEAEGYGSVTQPTVSRILSDAARVKSAARVAAARRTKVERRTKPQAGTTPTPPEAIPGWESVSLRTLRGKLEQAEEMSRIVREQGDLVEWGRLARTIAAIASKIEAREDELRAREETRQRERQAKRDAVESAEQRQGEALAKLRLLIAQQEAARAQHR